MLALLLRWVVNAAALMLVAYLYPGVQVDSPGAAILAAIVLGLVNAVIRPILLVLTLPVTILKVTNGKVHFLTVRRPQIDPKTLLPL